MGEQVGREDAEHLLLVERQTAVVPELGVVGDHPGTNTVPGRYAAPLAQA